MTESIEYELRECRLEIERHHRDFARIQELASQADIFDQEHLVRTLLAILNIVG